jgi:hypothetical protein
MKHATTSLNTGRMAAASLLVFGLAGAGALAGSRTGVTLFWVSAVIATDPLRSLATAEWWARSDSNRGPRDSLDPAVSGGSGLSLHPCRVRDALACH